MRKPGAVEQTAPGFSEKERQENEKEFLDITYIHPYYSIRHLVLQQKKLNKLLHGSRKNKLKIVQYAQQKETKSDRIRLVICLLQVVKTLHGQFFLYENPF